jgi:hypothetical protein
MYPLKIISDVHPRWLLLLKKKNSLYDQNLFIYKAYAPFSLPMLILHKFVNNFNTLGVDLVQNEPHHHLIEN